MDVYYYELGDWEFNLKIKFMGTFRLWLNAIGRIIRYIAGGLWMFIKGGLVCVNHVGCLVDV